MIALLLIVSAVGLVLTVALAPRKHLVHAARARNFPKHRRVSSKWWPSTLIFDKCGKRVSRRKKFFGEALGGSMEAHGIANGQEFYGARIDHLSVAERRELLNAGDIVVVDAEAKYSKTGKRLRKIKEIKGDGTVRFEDDVNGKGHTPRPIGQVVVIVESTID